MERIILEKYFNNNDLIKEFEILKKFKSHNILNERLDLYKDFSINLLYYIYNTYLGDEYIKTKYDMEGHYNWCFGKVLEEFDQQEFDFYGNDDLYDYFLKYYMNQFYKSKSIPTINHFKKLWNDLFDYKKSNKSKNKLELLIDLYYIFNISLDKKFKEVELI